MTICRPFARALACFAAGAAGLSASDAKATEGAASYYFAGGFGSFLLWTPEALKGRAAIVLKWLHDISNTNRLNGDWARWRSRIAFDQGGSACFAVPSQSLHCRPQRCGLRTGAAIW